MSLNFLILHLVVFYFFPVICGLFQVWYEQLFSEDPSTRSLVHEAMSAGFQWIPIGNWAIPFVQFCALIKFASSPIWRPIFTVANFVFNIGNSIRQQYYKVRCFFQNRFQIWN